MDERNITIQELEDKKRSDTEARNRLLTELGDTLLQRIGEGNLFPENAGEEADAIVTEYRSLQKEIADSEDIIKSLEADVERLKELESEIALKEGEESRLQKELEEVYGRLGKALLEEPASEINAAPKQQEEILLGKISEQEEKLAELEEKEGNIFAWLGKNAQMAVSKALLLKNKSALQRLYRGTGEKYLSAGTGQTIDGEAAEKALELKGLLSTLAVDLALLKGERRNIGDLFGAEGSPSRRILVLERHITHIKEGFTAVYLRFGSLVVEDANALSSILREEDGPVLEKAGLLASQIAEKEQNIKRIKAAISIDDEKDDIEKKKSAILAQEQKIAAAEEAIKGLERQITESEKRIDELNAFLRETNVLDEHAGQNV